MRVIHVYKDVSPVKGGMENYMLALCMRLRRAHGIDAQILVTSPGHHTEHTTISGVPTTKAARLATVASTPLSPRLIPLLRNLQPDLVHLHVPYPMGELAYLLATPQTPMVITYQSDVVRQKNLMRLYGIIFEQVLRRAHVIMPTSTQYLHSSAWLRRHAARCHVVPLGIDQQRFQQPDEATLNLASDLRKRYGPNLLYSHGVFRYYKGLSYLIEIMPMLPEAHLLLTGAGPEEQALRAQAMRTSAENRIHFAGPVSDDELPAYYHAADVYVLPAIARSEAFGISMVEAQSSGLPCISTELGTGTSYVNEDGVTGLVIPAGDDQALAEAAERLLSNATLRQKLGAQAQQRAAALFDITDNAASVAAIYHDILLRGSI